jgi:hypothetical protein
MTAGDFNRDGNLDLAVNLSGFDNFAILTGDGQGGFTLKSHVAIDTLSKSVVSGDVNGDGLDDLIIGSRNSDPADTGATFVVFGKTGGFAASFDLSTRQDRLPPERGGAQ